MRNARSYRGDVQFPVHAQFSHWNITVNTSYRLHSIRIRNAWSAQRKELLPRIVKEVSFLLTNSARSNERTLFKERSWRLISEECSLDVPRRVVMATARLNGLTRLRTSLPPSPAQSRRLVQQTGLIGPASFQSEAEPSIPFRHTARRFDTRCFLRRTF